MNYYLRADGKLVYFPNDGDRAFTNLMAYLAAHKPIEAMWWGTLRDRFPEGPTNTTLVDEVVASGTFQLNPYRYYFYLGFSDALADMSLGRE